MIRVRVSLAVLTLVFAIVVPCRLSPATHTIQNDDFAGSATSAVLVPELSLGESYAVRFVPPEWAGPVTVQKVQYLMTNNPAYGGTCCGMFWLRMYEDEDNSDNDPGDLVYDTEPSESALEIYGDNDALHEFDLSSISVSRPSFDGPFRVELNATMRDCATMAGNRHFPLLYVDGADQSDENFLFGNIGTGEFLTWFDGTELGGASISGDFVMRVVVQTTNDPPGGPDVVIPDPDVVGPEPDIDEPTPDVPEAPEDTWVEEVATPDTWTVDLYVSLDVPGDPDVPVAGLRVDEILPSSADNDDDTAVQILGAGFQTGVRVHLDATELVVSEVSPASLMAFVPAGMTPGMKTVVVKNPDGEVVTLAQGFEVTVPSEPGVDVLSSDDTTPWQSGSSNSCTPVAPRLRPLGELIVLLVALVLAVRQRRPSQHKE